MTLVMFTSFVGFLELSVIELLTGMEQTVRQTYRVQCGDHCIAPCMSVCPWSDIQGAVWRPFHYTLYVCLSVVRHTGCDHCIAPCMSVCPWSDIQGAVWRPLHCTLYVCLSVVRHTGCSFGTISLHPV